MEICFWRRMDEARASRSRARARPRNHCRSCGRHVDRSLRVASLKITRTGSVEEAGELQLVFRALANFGSGIFLGQVLEQLPAEVFLVGIERLDEVEADVEEVVGLEVALFAQACGQRKAGAEERDQLGQRGIGRACGAKQILARCLETD